MNTVTISVEPMASVTGRMQRAFGGETQGHHISFPSVELLWRVLAPKRMDIVRVLTGQPPLAIREVARRVGRDVKAVHADVTALLNAGVLDRTDDGVVFPYDDVHIDFRLATAA